MDTDELSNETYNAVILTAEYFHHDLTLRFGVLAADCNDDTDYLLKAKKLILTWKGNLKYYSESVFFDYPKPSTSSFEQVLSEIEILIDKVIEVPINKRHFEF